MLISVLVATSVSMVSGMFYKYPTESVPTSAIYKLEQGKVVWNLPTTLVKTSSFMTDFGLVFQGCVPNAVISCEVLIIDSKDGKILQDVVGIISKKAKTYVISSNSLSKDTGGFENYLVRDTVHTLNGYKFYSTLIQQRSNCGSFEILDSEFKLNRLFYTLRDSCGTRTVNIPVKEKD